jgi:hypothetical protein
MARPQAETTTLLFAVAVAVTLGVACGVWVNTKLTAAASETLASEALRAPARLTRAAPGGQTAPAPDGDTKAVSGDSHQQAVSDDSHQTVSGNGEETSADYRDAPSQTQTRSLPPASDDGRKGRPAPAGLAPVAREANPSEKSPAARDRAREVDAVPRGRSRAGGAAPCAPYASAGSLKVRGGGAATVVVGGPGEAGGVTVTTPDWADIAVFSEGRGGNGWVRYSVRSVSRRQGVYTLHIKTPCGSQRIPVTVTRP